MYRLAILYLLSIGNSSIRGIDSRAPKISNIILREKSSRIILSLMVQPYYMIILSSNTHLKSESVTCVKYMWRERKRRDTKELQHF